MMFGALQRYPHDGSISGDGRMCRRRVPPIWRVWCRVLSRKFVSKTGHRPRVRMERGRREVRDEVIVEVPALAIADLGLRLGLGAPNEGR
jgi:hypothetical protein